MTKNQKINNYIANRMSENDKSDFEAEMRMDSEIEIEVARIILKKLKEEDRLQDIIEKPVVANDNNLFAQNRHFIEDKDSIKDIFFQKWGKIFYCFSNN